MVGYNLLYYSVLAVWVKVSEESVEMHDERFKCIVQAGRVWWEMTRRLSEIHATNSKLFLDRSQL